jgi:hypothetical protein
MSIYKTFREVQQPATMWAISPRFDQPTYLSFKLGFGRKMYRYFFDILFQRGRPAD